MKGRLAGALLVVTIADAGLRPAERLTDLTKLEAALLESEEQLRDDAAVHPNFKRDAVERLLRLYKVWNSADPNSGKSEQAAHWRQKLASFDREEAQRRTVTFRPKPAAE